jgi:peptidoglycan/LPS O-acetylase OafA/YrhL
MMTNVSAMAQADGATNTSVTNPKAFYIASLNGIRALAFLLVFFSHAGLRHLVPGGFGVTVFFVLSGYLITTLLRLEVEETGKIDFKAFYLRRTFRILPLFYIVLVCAILFRWLGVLGGGFNRLGVTSQITHWSNYYLIWHGPEAVIAGTIVLWSLAVEEHFYLVFPWLYHWMNRGLKKNGQVLVLVAACVLCLVWRCVLIFVFKDENVRTEIATDTRFDSLLMGAALAIGANPALDKNRWFSIKTLRWLALAGLGVLLFTFLWRNDGFRFTLRFTLQSMALLPLFAYAILARGSVTYRALNTWGMNQLGVLSYALYLTHSIFLEYFTVHLHAGAVVIGAATLAAAIAEAKLLQVAVEKPMHRLRKRYSRIHA